MTKDIDILLSHLDGKPVPVEVRELRKSFGRFEVLKGVNLNVSPGEMFVLIGRSGSGKTSLIRHIAGLDEPDEGDVSVDSVPVGDLFAPHRAKGLPTVSLVFQSSALFNSMTVAQNLELFIREHNTVTDEGRIREISSAALSVVGLAGKGASVPSELSGGMKRRVAIARALLTNPNLILFDEPTTGLDPVTKKSIEQMLLVLKREVGVTQMVVTHDIRLAFSLADRLSIMHEGRIIQTGTGDEINSSANPLVRNLLSGTGAEEYENGSKK